MARSPKAKKPKFRVGDKVRDKFGHVAEGRVVAVGVCFFYDILVVKPGSEHAKKCELIEGCADDELRPLTAREKGRSDVESSGYISWSEHRRILAEQIASAAAKGRLDAFEDAANECEGTQREGKWFTDEKRTPAQIYNAAVCECADHIRKLADLEKQKAELEANAK